MQTLYRFQSGHLAPSTATDDEAQKPVWIDLLEPSAEEEAAVERQYGVALPSRETMQEIEASSRLFEDQGALYATVLMVSGLDGQHPQKSPVSFVLKDNLLVTVRRSDPLPFRSFAARAAKPHAVVCETGPQVLVALFETIVDRLADGLESVADSVDHLSREIFRRRHGKEKAQARDLEAALSQIGRSGEFVALIQESMLSLSRATAFLNAVEPDGTREGRRRLKLIQRDLDSLSEHAAGLNDKVTFLLDATLGLISIEQNNIMKIFSIVSVVFMPPTLVASVYGMNFERMPELGWTYGYPYALILMLLFAVLPFLFFRSKGWL